MRKACLGIGLLVLLAGCATVGTAPPGEVTAEMEFPAPGTQWMTKTVDQAGGTSTTTWNVLDQDTYKGKPVYRVSDQVNVVLYDTVTRSWMATLRFEDERQSASPHNGSFSWPLSVGKRWMARYSYIDNQNRRSFRDVQSHWSVEAYEDITVPAGSFKAFRLHTFQGGGSSYTTLWYAPEVKLVVKEVVERTVLHFQGPGKFTTELIQNAPPGGERWYGFGYEATQEAIQRGEAREALAFYERQAIELERRGLKIEAAQAHMAALWAATPLGLYQRGIRAGLRALDLLATERRNDDIIEKLVTARVNVAFIYRIVGDFQQARRHLEEGVELVPNLTNSLSRLLRSATLQRNLAILANAEVNFREGIRHASESIRLLERYLSALQTDSLLDGRVRAGRRDLGRNFALIATAHRRLGDLAAAEPFLARALTIAREVRIETMEIDALSQLGRIALSRREPAQAEAYFRDARTLATKLNSVSTLMWSHSGLGWSHFQQGQFGEALASFRQALDLVEDIRSELQESGLRSGFLDDKQEMYHGAVWSAIELGRPGEAFSFAERGRSRAFLDLLGTETLLSKGRTRALVEEEVRLRAQLSEAKALAQETATGERVVARKQVEAADRAYRAFLEWVRKENAEQASLTTVEPLSLEEVQKLLPERTALLEYLVTPQGVLLWVIHRDRAEVVRLPGPRTSLVTQVRALRSAIAEQAPIEEIRKLATALYGRLVGPARARIRADRLLIVPHDVLHYLPFSALRTPAGRWLVDDYTLVTLPSASVLKYLGEKGQAASGEVVAIGNPDIGSALNLRYAEREARAVGEHFPGARLLLRRDATEAQVKALSGAAGVLHFATHGELSEQEPLSSALLLVPDGKEDGRLEVREIFGLDLKARLVVLSACETGLGKLSNGDELVGLQRAFLYAGTPAVVTTLWKVDDQASYRLMREFYEQLTANGPADALRQAQRMAMGEFPHPFYWAAFTMTGSPQ